ncbi:MAG: PEP-CTERM sorting domain-containing protein [Kiritimatiellae bacterium]|nr:PEP-CTERM sorting domain-containing protein [Kiritimatiellia bacterium]
MKKLIIAAFAVAFGMAASAATYNWKASNDWFSPDGSDDLAGTVYIFDGSQFTISAITDNLTGSLSNALGSQALSYGMFDVSGSGLTDDDASTAFAHMFAVVVNDAGDAYWVSEMQDLEITDAIKGGATAQFAFGDVENIAFTPMAVPEPTSGLLLLLGFAGLALRRRRA